MSAHESTSEDVIFAAAITLKNGKRLIAANYGLKGFPIKVRKEPPKQSPEK